MIDALNTGYLKTVDLLTKTSAASWILDLLGRTLVAKPEDLKQAPHFWHDSEDRQLPSSAEYRLPKIQAGQVASDHFRRHLQRDLALMGSIVAMGLCAVIFVISLIVIAIVGPGDGQQVGALPVAGYATATGAKGSADCGTLADQVRQISAAYGNTLTDLSQLTQTEQRVIADYTSNCGGN